MDQIAVDKLYIRLFVASLNEGKDGVALSLLDKGHVTVHSRYSNPALSVTCTMLMVAIQADREKVVRALLRLGANFDEFIDIGDGSLSAVGLAILLNKVSMLWLFHRLGANMSDVWKPKAFGLLPPSSVSHSVLETSIVLVRPACLVYELDYINPERPINFTPRALSMLCMGAKDGAPVIKLFQILKARGFNFESLARPSEFQLNSLGEIETDAARIASSAQGEAANRVKFSDLLLMSAQRSGNASLMRYLVKDLGIVSDSRRINPTLSFLEATREALGVPDDNLKTPDAKLEKYKCVACPAVCATMWCTGCKMVRYCSKECQGKHWKTGGHKKECAKLRKSAAQTSSGGAGPSQVKK